jgi:hypothetical protein
LFGDLKISGTWSPKIRDCRGEIIGPAEIKFKNTSSHKSFTLKVPKISFLSIYNFREKDSDASIKYLKSKKIKLLISNNLKFEKLLVKDKKNNPMISRIHDYANKDVITFIGQNVFHSPYSSSMFMYDIDYDGNDELILRIPCETRLHNLYMSYNIESTKENFNIDKNEMFSINFLANAIFNIKNKTIEFMLSSRAATFTKKYYKAFGNSYRLVRYDEQDYCENKIDYTHYCESICVRDQKDKFICNKQRKQK